MPNINRLFVLLLSQNDLPSHESSSKSSSPSRAASKRGPKPTTLRKLPPSTRTAVTTSGDNHAGYSRSPELRESHKIAERKRRKDMKEMFDELQDVLPYKRLPKHSKSDILTQCMYHEAVLVSVPSDTALFFLTL